jgi:cytochrome c oxidase assembly protein subunit 15
MKNLRVVSFVTMFLAIFVLMLGAYTRLTDAGLGCPDWPGCYGKLVLPSGKDAISDAQKAYPQIPIESSKAWTEMAHRYAAGTLLLLLFFIIFKSLGRGHLEFKIPRFLPLALLGLLVFQGLLGMWTVTFKLLPIVVASHLLGGISIFSCVVFFCWQLSGIRGFNLPRYKNWLNIGVIIVLMQIASGGLVSANYAGIACIGFPKCNGMWLPDLEFSRAFNLFPGIGENYQGGTLDSISRMTLQFIHRLGAILTLSYILFISFWILKSEKVHFIRKFAILTILMVTLQFCLGIINVVFLLPLWAAVLHNGCAAILLAMLVSMRYLVSNGEVNGK